MKHQIVRSDLAVPYGTVCLASLLLLFVLPLTTSYLINTFNRLIS